jgi:hypothetical protein
MILLKQLLAENNEIQFPVIVDGSFKGKSGDEFHAFEDTHGKTIGGMNTEVNKELEKIYAAGFNPNISDVSITMNNKGYLVKWVVTITESKDQKAWIGIYSRGGAGSGTVPHADPTNPNNPSSPGKAVKSSTIRNRGTVDDFVQILDHKYYPKNGGVHVRQIFYKYTLDEFQPHPPKSKSTQTTPYIDVTYTLNKPPYADLLRNPRAERIASVIKQSRGTFNDYEAWAEAAFMAIKTKSKYADVSKLLRRDAYKYVKEFMDTATKYHKQSIDTSYFSISSESLYK